MPSLFIFGTEDRGFPAHITGKVFAEPNVIGAHVRLALVEGASHFVLDEQPDATTTLTVEYFTSV